MPNHIKLAALIGLLVAHDIKTQIAANKAARLYLKAQATFEEIEADNHAQISYLCHMLEKHEVPASEFDLIALKFHS